tara:strand:- start:127 stop:801 length:675 start_codon:yes stop_codon:yes gene_type:complete
MTTELFMFQPIFTMLKSRITMNLEKLKEAEGRFLMRYPLGFDDPALLPIKKKHNVDKLINLAKVNLTQLNCHQPNFIADTLIDIVSRSSMVSRFEKPPFRDFVNSLDGHEKETLAFAVEQRLYGNKRKGFELLVGLLLPYKIAKWSVISAVPFYFSPRREVFVKPTTAKNIIAFLEVKDLFYDPIPSWDFYTGYRKLIVEIKKNVHRSLSPNNAALTGFLMFSI